MSAAHRELCAADAAPAAWPARPLARAAQDRGKTLRAAQRQRRRSWRMLACAQDARPAAVMVCCTPDSRYRSFRAGRRSGAARCRAQSGVALGERRPTALRLHCVQGLLPVVDADGLVSGLQHWREVSSALIAGGAGAIYPAEDGAYAGVNQPGPPDQLDAPLAGAVP
jgi:hypothetical protein